MLARRYESASDQATYLRNIAAVVQTDSHRRCVAIVMTTSGV